MKKCLSVLLLVWCLGLVAGCGESSPTQSSGSQPQGNKINKPPAPPSIPNPPRK